MQVFHLSSNLHWDVVFDAAVDFRHHPSQFNTVYEESVSHTIYVHTTSAIFILAQNKEVDTMMWGIKICSR